MTKFFKLAQLIVGLGAFIGVNGLANAEDSVSNTLVCAGPTIYSSVIFRTAGIPPLPGDILEKHLLVYNREILANFDVISGQQTGDAPAYAMNLSGTAEIIEETGSPGLGSKTFKQVAVIVQSQPVVATLGQEDVVCKQTWALVP